MANPSFLSTIPRSTLNPGKFEKRNFGRVEVDAQLETNKGVYDILDASVSGVRIAKVYLGKAGQVVTGVVRYMHEGSEYFQKMRLVVQSSPDEEVTRLSILTAFYPREASEIEIEGGD